MTVHFLAAVVDGMEPWNVAVCLNWVEQSPFELAAALSGARLINPGPIARPGQVQKMSVGPSFFIFVEGTPEDFKEYFGFDYDIERLPELSNIIALKQREIEQQQQAAKTVK